MLRNIEDAVVASEENVCICCVFIRRIIWKQTDVSFTRIYARQIETEEKKTKHACISDVKKTIEAETSRIWSINFIS